MIRFGIAGVFLLVASAASSPGHADQTDPQLDRLFADLKAAPDLGTAQMIEGQIWAIWVQSAEDAINGLMQSGTARLGAGDFDGALAVFNQLVARFPRYAEGWNKRATTLYLLGRYTDSVRDIGHVLELEPRHFGALSGLGMCDAQLNRTKEALDALRRAQAIDPLLPGIAANIEALRKQLERETI